MQQTEQRKTELDYLNIEGMYGGNQELFSDLWMNVGGCAAVAACDLSVWMDLYRGTGLCPYPAAGITKADYEKFAMIMKPYLRPRRHGVNKLWMFTEGFGKYLEDCGCTAVSMKTVNGSEDTETAVRAVKEQIDAGVPVIYLNLNHRAPEYEDYVWHWFMLTGYEDTDEGMLVKTASCGETEWIDFRGLWESGFEEKGGMVMLRTGNRSSENKSEQTGLSAGCENGAAAVSPVFPGDAARTFREGRFLTLKEENRLGEDLESAVECTDSVMNGAVEDRLYIFFLRLVREGLLKATEEDIRKAAEEENIRNSLRSDQKLLTTLFKEESDGISLLNTLVLYIAYRKKGYPDHSPEFMRTVGVFRKKIEAFYKKEVQHICG